jgi:uncharacterized protein YndB with AHSA1/START domain
MKTITTSHTTTSAAPASVFAVWADMQTWPQWNRDTEWVRLDGPFRAGSTGVLKPKGGPRVKFVIERLEPDSEFVDVSRLWGARLRFDHRVTPQRGGGCAIDVTVSITGPLAGLWSRIIGSGLRESSQPDLDQLATTAELRAAAAAAQPA